MQNISFSKPHRLLTNEHCLTTCSINFQNQHLTTQTWVWMSVVKKSPPITTDSSKAKAAHLFHMLITQTSTQDQLAIPCVTMILYIQGHQANWMPPPKPQTTPNTTAEYMETFQQMARNCTIPTSNLPPAPFLCQPWRSSVYTEFNAECTWGTHSRNTT